VFFIGLSALGVVEIDDPSYLEGLGWRARQELLDRLRGLSGAGAPAVAISLPIPPPTFANLDAVAPQGERALQRDLVCGRRPTGQQRQGGSQQGEGERKSRRFRQSGHGPPPSLERGYSIFGTRAQLPLTVSLAMMLSS
jgi:hypothetical protein